jgi:hypothetical protein
VSARLPSRRGITSKEASRGWRRRLAALPGLALVGLTLTTSPAAFAAATTGNVAPNSAPSDAPAGNLVDNGGFESPAIGPNTFVEIAPPAILTDWSIELGTIDLVSEPYWGAPEGDQVLDIDGTDGASTAGTISQDVPTSEGIAYKLGFQYSGNPDCGDIGDVSMDVYWNSDLVGTVTHDTVADLPDRTVASFDYQAFEVDVVGAGGGAERTTLQFDSLSATSSTCGIVLDDVYVVHAAPPVWQAIGDGAVSVLNDGSSGAPKMSYAYDLGIGGGVSGEWHFFTTATTTETINLPYTYTGLHAWFQVTVTLEAFVISADAGDSGVTLVDDGPVDCCTPPSNGFSYTGTVPLDVEPGDIYGFSMTGSNFDLNSFLKGTLTVGGAAPAPTLMRAVSTGGTGAAILGRVDGMPNTPITVEVATADTCTDGALNGGAPVSGGPASVTTDDEGYFAATVSGVQPGDYVTARLTSPAATADSACIVSSADNDYWPKALDLDDSLFAAEDVIDSQGKARWYKFSVTPGQRIDIKLSGLPADYDLAVFKDIGKEFLALLDPEDADDLTKLSAEYAPSVFSPSVFSPSVFSPSVFSPDAYAPSVFSPSVFSPSVFSPSVFSPSVFSPSVFSPSVFSPSVFSPSVFSPSVFSPSVFSPSVFSPSVFSPTEVSQAFSSAQTRTLIGVSATPGTGDETVVVNSFNNTGEFYVRVSGHAGAFDTSSQYTVEVAQGATDCAGVDDTTLTPRADNLATGKKTIVLTDSSELALGDTSPDTLRTKLNTFMARYEVGGVLVDVALDSRVNELKQQLDDNKGCPFAANLLAEEIKGIVDSYRPNNPGLRYVVVLGGDTVVPFFRYPDQSLLGQESGYVPPVKSDSISEASLRHDFVLSQDAYGSGVSVSLRTSEFPVPGLAVGRLVETPTEIAGMLDAYIAAGGVVSPGSSLVTGYDFLADAANAVKAELQSGTGQAPDTLITANGISPQDPASWTAAQLRTKVLGSRHDVMFLAGHFSANSALAADFQTSFLTTELAASSLNLTNSIVFSAGCHSGYNLVDDEALPGVALPLDWTQAFARKGATLIAGTGYQYGDTDFLEYSERLYRDFARELRAGPSGSAISIGEALTRAKLTYLATTPDVRGIHEKALLEATLFGLPMLGVNMPSGRGAIPGTIPTIDPIEVAPVNGTDLGLATYELSVGPTLTPDSVDLKNPPYDAIPGTFTEATWLAGPNGVVTNPAEPALPLSASNVTSTNGAQVLRGVGFRGGIYADESPVVPLTGAPTTELRGVHAPFVSPVFYPMRMWTPNYYGELGGTGGTNLLVTPVQHKADPANPGKSIRRSYSDLDLRLFYSSNLTTAALSDAPSIVGVGAQPNGGAVDFTIQVVGDPKAHIHGVWVTHTNGTGSWESLDLVQDSGDSSLWKGTLPSAGPNLQFVVQAANGLGLVAFDDNRGSYYTAAAGALADTTLTLISPPSSGTFGDSPVITAELKAGATPLAGKSVIVTIGGSSVIATTAANGRVTPAVPLNSTPGTTQISASFGGDSAFGPSSDSHSPFTVNQASSSLSAFTSQFSVVTPSGNSGISTLLTAPVGGSTQALSFETVTFTLTGPSSKTYSTITDFTGKAILPTSGLVAGTYSVTASFAGNATYTGATRGGSLVVSVFAGFFQPVDNAPTLNIVTAGSAVPIKFSLGGNRGLAILAPGSPVVTTISCGTALPTDEIETTVAASSSGLQYDAASGQYSFIWKTTKGSTGCRQVNIKLVDGTDHIALFKFK